MTSSNEQLVPVEQPKPCPFCGGKAMVGETLDNAWYAMCEQDCCVTIERHWGTRAEALAVWNTRTPPAVEPDEGLVERVAEVVAEDGGCWSACSGCQESVDGYVSTRDYPYSHIFKCQPGGGCHECGGIGVTWMDGKFLAGYGEALEPSIRAQTLEEAAPLKFEPKLAKEWWEAKMPNSQFVSASLMGDGYVKIFWRDPDESDKYNIPWITMSRDLAALKGGQGV